MKSIQWIAILATLGGVIQNMPAAPAAAEDGVALAIVYDTSGSMKDPVRDSSGKSSPKYVVANRALENIAQRVQSFATNATASGPRQVQAGLFVFAGTGARTAIPFRTFDAAVFQSWAKTFSTPNGNTPLGNAVRAAAQAVLNSKLSRKHVLVLTDGESNSGPAPDAVIPGLRRQAEQAGAVISFHFVAFDVNAQVFNGVKKLGATVVSAADETQLNTQLEFILSQKILLEDEGPPKTK